MDFIWILIAFLFGFAVKQVGLPPLIGYLIAGFTLNGLGVEPFEGLAELADMGITLLLFTIGLKIDARSLAKLEIAGTGSFHMLIWTLSIALIFFGVAWFGVSAFAQLDGNTALLIAFALSFSSTVCVVKVLEEKTELKTRHGKISIGILVIQDIVAVLFLVFASGKIPSIYALGLFLLIPLAPLLVKLVEKSGHDELLPLVGFFLALGGAELFYAVNMKGDLGALLIGMLLASSSKATELYKSLMSFKDLFLIGFFLSIGFVAIPTLDMLVISAGLTLLLVLKFIVFFFVFVGIGLRARTSFLSSLALSNFSEFGLIVGTLSVENKWLSEEWLVILAISVAISFVIISFLYKHAHELYARFNKKIHRFQRTTGLRQPALGIPEGAEVLIIGMGRVGTGAYDELEPELHEKVWGVEADSDRAERQRQAGYDVVFADADDFDFWEHIELEKITLIMLAIPSVNEMKSIITLLKMSKYKGRIAAVAHYEDERQELKELGADVVFNYYAEVGSGFAEESRHLLKLD